MSKKQILGLMGSIILFVGVFTPLVSLPFVGTVNYFANGKGDGTIVLVFAVISLILVLIKKYKGLWLTGLGSLVMIAYTFINLQTRMASVREEMQKSLEGNPFAGLGDLALQSVQMQWGWAILIVGVGSILSAVIIKDEHKK